MTTREHLALAALGYARRGWAVFPLHNLRPNGTCSCGNLNCKPNNRAKHPRTRNGLKDATTDEGQIRAWWGKWPDANIGIATGAVSGIVVLDVDTNKGGKESLVNLELEHEPLPETPTSLTGGGGWHIVFAHPGQEVKNSASKLGPGLDVRGDGGYIVAPPSLHASGAFYDWLVSPDDAPLATIPAWLLALMLKPARQAPAGDLSERTNGHRPAAPTTRHEKYGQAALQYECDYLAGLAKGSRNEYLNIAAFKLGQLVAAGALTRDEVERELEKACIANGLIEDDGEEAFRKTRKSGLEAGMRAPRDLPEPEPPSRPRRRAQILNEPPPAPPFEDDGEPPAIDLPRGFDLLHYRAEDGGILDAWRDLYGPEWHYVTGWETWIRWNGTHWEKDESQQLQKQIQDLLDTMNRLARTRLRNAADKEEEKIYKNYFNATKRTKSRVASIEGMAQSQRAIRAADLDAGNVLNLSNGTLDLTTFEFRPHSPTDLLTYVLPYRYDPDADCPRWRRFLSEVLVTEETLAPDPTLATLYQELFGYSLTTETKHEKMIWLAGEGGNGKTVSIGVLQSLLGPLAINVDFQTLGLPGNYDLARLPGRRVIFSTESERGGKMVESLIRRIVSGEKITGRPIYGKPFEFNPVAKIWWAMNDKPTIRDTSNATWRRLELIPFNRTFDDQTKDPDLAEKLQAELPGILNWALEGLRRLRRQGRFTEATAVKEAVEELRKESNPVALYIEERTVELSTPVTPAMTLYADYENWCKATGRIALNETNFGRELKRLGVTKKRTGMGNVYNIGLRTIGKDSEIENIPF